MTEQEQLLTLALVKQHGAFGATMGEEGGWSVPLHYGAPLDEARMVRRRAGVFDVSGIGRLRVRGDGALTLLERVCTADVAHQEDNTTIHTLLCNEAGGIIDECYLVRLESFWVLTTTACNREKVIAHLEAQAIDGAKIGDQTRKVSQLAVVGPAAEDILDEVLPVDVAGLAPGTAKMGSLMVAKYIASRTSYVGGWGLEVMLPNMLIGQGWKFITKQAGDKSLSPIGSVARDILRIEAGHCRYGHEISEAINPVVAGLMDCVDFGHDFLGAEAIQAAMQSPPSRTRVGLECEAIAKLGDVVQSSEGGEIGTVTSGAFSPTLEKAIAMAYVSPDSATPGTVVNVISDGNTNPGTVVELPFLGPI